MWLYPEQPKQKTLSKNSALFKAGIINRGMQKGSYLRLFFIYKERYNEYAHTGTNE
jgi:hypothetical protein